MIPSAINHVTFALRVVAVHSESPEWNGTTSRKQQQNMFYKCAKTTEICHILKPITAGRIEDKLSH